MKLFHDEFGQPSEKIVGFCGGQADLHTAARGAGTIDEDFHGMWISEHDNNTHTSNR